MKVVYLFLALAAAVLGVALGLWLASVYYVGPTATDQGAYVRELREALP